MKFVSTETLFLLCISLSLVLGSLKVKIQQYHGFRKNGPTMLANIEIDSNARSSSVGTTWDRKNRIGIFQITKGKLKGTYEIQSMRIHTNGGTGELLNKDRVLVQATRLGDNKHKRILFNYLSEDGPILLDWCSKAARLSDTIHADKFVQGYYSRNSLRMSMGKKTDVFGRSCMTIQMDFDEDDNNKLNTLDVKIPKRNDWTVYYEGWGKGATIIRVTPQVPRIGENYSWFIIHVKGSDGKEWKRNVYPYDEDAAYFFDAVKFLRAVEGKSSKLFNNWKKRERLALGLGPKKLASKSKKVRSKFRRTACSDDIMFRESLPRRNRRSRSSKSRSRTRSKWASGDYLH